jgi:hypothetical protein
MMAATDDRAGEHPGGVLHGIAAAVASEFVIAAEKGDLVAIADVLADVAYGVAIHQAPRPQFRILIRSAGSRRRRAPAPGLTRYSRQ